MRKKLLSLAMSFVMVVTFMPTMALTSFAETVAESVSEVSYIYEETPLTEVASGDAGMLVYYSGSNKKYAITKAVSDGMGLQRAQVNVVDSTIESPRADATVWTVGKAESNYNFQSDSKYMSKVDNILATSDSKFEWELAGSRLHSDDSYISYDSPNFILDASGCEIHFFKKVEAYDRKIKVIPVSGDATSSRNLTLNTNTDIKVNILNTSTDTLDFEVFGEDNATEKLTINGSNASSVSIPAAKTGSFRITTGDTAVEDAKVIITSDKDAEKAYKTELHIKIIDSGSDEDAPASEFASGINLAITSDVHGSIDELKQWQDNIVNKTFINNKPQKMIFCGDYSYENDLSAYLKEFGDVVSLTDEHFGKNNGIYTSGNHEYQSDMSNDLSPLFESNKNFKRTGWAVKPTEGDNQYGVYCLGAAGWYDAVGAYPDEDIKALDKALSDVSEGAKGKPIFFVAHFPLHAFGSRETTNARNLINVLNKYPNVIFLWGHNHSQEDTRYGQITPAGEKLKYSAEREAKTINFTYACAGAMHDGQSIDYRGMVANINNGKVTMQYFGYDGKVVSDATTITIGGTPVSSDEDFLEINNGTTELEKTVGCDKSFILDIMNSPVTYSSWWWTWTESNPHSYSVDSYDTDIATVTVASGDPGQPVEVQPNEVLQYTISTHKAGSTTLAVSRDGSVFAKIKLNVLKSDGTLVIDDTIYIAPSTSNPVVKKKIDIGDTLKFVVVNESTNSNYTFGIANDNTNAATVKNASGDASIDSIHVDKNSFARMQINGLAAGKSRIVLNNNNPGYERKATIIVSVGEFEDDTVKYLAIGDSIGAGVKGGNGDSSEYNAYNTYSSNGSKNWNVNAVSYSYVNLFAKDIRADQDESWNGTAAGFRAKEICYMLDLEAYQGDGYNYDLSKVTWDDLVESGFDLTKVDIDDYYGWSMGKSLGWKKMFTKINKDIYKEAVEDADVITVELGANEFNAFAMYGPLMNKILPALMEAINKTMSIGRTQDAQLLEETYEEIVEIMENPAELNFDDITDLGKLLQQVRDLVGDIADMGASYSELVDVLTDSFDYAYKSFRYYWKTLMAYIHEVNPDAIVIATSVPNPMKGMDISSYIGGMSGLGINLGGIDISQLDPGDLVSPFINDMNNYLKNNARRYGYSIADISDVELNPKKADGTPNGDYKWHPDNEGHEILFNAVKKTYDKAVENRNNSNRIITAIRNFFTRIFSFFDWF